MNNYSIQLLHSTIEIYISAVLYLYYMCFKYHQRKYSSVMENISILSDRRVKDISSPSGCRSSTFIKIYLVFRRQLTMKPFLILIRYHGVHREKINKSLDVFQRKTKWTNMNFLFFSGEGGVVVNFDLIDSWFSLFLYNWSEFPRYGKVGLAKISITLENAVPIVRNSM